MTVVDERVYQFVTAAQWAAGARRNLAFSGDRLVVPDQLAVVPIPGAAEAGVLPAVDDGGVLWWLRPSGRLVRRPLPGTRGPVVGGRLDGPAPARRLLHGRSLLWVLTDRGLERYAATTLQPLTPVVRPGISDVDGDGGDGVWLVELGSGGEWWLQHVDCWGRSCLPPIAIPGATGGAPAVAVVGDRLVVIEPAASTQAYVVNPATGAVTAIGLDRVHDGRPTWLTGAGDTRIHLLTATSDDRAVYQAVSLTGSVEDNQELDLPLGRPTALVGGPAGLVAACARGLADIAARPGRTGDRTSTFITPALVSPPGPRSGWDRAEIDVVLPVGTGMDVTWAATDDPWTAAQATSLLDGPAPADLVDQLDALLPWRDDQAATYSGESDTGEAERLAALLDAAAAATLWLRVRLHTPPGRVPPALVALRVRYPDVSYLDDLPAVYREDPQAAAELRRILAPYELLFDGLDAELAALPDGIDPATADETRTDHLLSWLGFPPLGDLPARIRSALLARAAELLDLRGTHAGLQLLLDLVTDGRATVADSADEPIAWFLGPGLGPSVGAAPARLGVDTVSLAQRPSPARAGGMILGRTPLGRGCPDPELVLAERAATTTVTVEVDPQRRRALQPVLERLIPVFVPAHCRLRVRYTATDAADRSRRLDVDFRLDASTLHSAVHWRLGATTRPGAWTLPAPPCRPVVLDHGAPLGGPQRLH